MGTRAIAATVLIALGACSTGAGPRPARQDVTAAPIDAAAPDDAAAVGATPKPVPALAWHGAAVIVDARWALDPASGKWTAIAGGRDARTPRITFPEEPGPAAAAGIREPSGNRTAWGEPGRVCLRTEGVAGYGCLMVPPRATE